MPIYEYKAADGAHCRLCRGTFEVRQAMGDEPLKTCPECGARVKKLFSRPFLLREESLGEEETFDRCAGEEADESRLAEDFNEDEIWE